MPLLLVQTYDRSSKIHLMINCVTSRLLTNQKNVKYNVKYVFLYMVLKWFGCNSTHGPLQKH